MPSPRSEVTVRRIDMADDLAAPLASRLVLMGATIQEHLEMIACEWPPALGMLCHDFPLSDRQIGVIFLFLQR